MSLTLELQGHLCHLAQRSPVETNKNLCQVNNKARMITHIDACETVAFSDNFDMHGIVPFGPQAYQSILRTPTPWAASL